MITKEITAPAKNIPLRILVVYDEPDITTTLKVGLEAEGFQADTFNDSKEALSKFRPGFYDLSPLQI